MSARLVKHKGVELELAGDIYVVPPLTLGALEQLQGRLAQVNLQQLDSTTINTVVDVVHSAIKRNYPELDRQFVIDAVDVANLEEVFSAVMDVSGLQRKRSEEQKKATAAVANGTGSTSTLTWPQVSDGPSTTAAKT